MSLAVRIILCLIRVFVSTFYFELHFLDYFCALILLRPNFANLSELDCRKECNVNETDCQKWFICVFLIDKDEK